MCINICFLSHQQFGEIEDCQMEDSSLSAVITFRTRAEAEQVHTHTHFNGITFSFYLTDGHTLMQ